MTNKEFAEKDEAFIAACQAGKVKPTARQASKFRRRRRLAFKATKEGTA